MKPFVIPKASIEEESVDDLRAAFEMVADKIDPSGPINTRVECDSAMRERIDRAVQHFNGGRTFWNPVLGGWNVRAAKKAR